MDKIICVGKNYVEHARELGDAVPEKPVLFLKPPSILRGPVKSGETLEASLPTGRGLVHHECEIVVRLRCGGSNLSVDEARDAIEAVTLGLDMTLRDLQSQLKKNGHPWEISKVFTDSAIIGEWIPVESFREFLETPFHFEVDGRVRQSAQGTRMSFSPAQCIALASEYFPLQAGDVIFTGTPEGVGPVQSGSLGALHWGDRLSYRVLWK